MSFFDFLKKPEKKKLILEQQQSAEITIDLTERARSVLGEVTNNLSETMHILDLELQRIEDEREFMPALEKLLSAAPARFLNLLITIIFFLRSSLERTFGETFVDEEMPTDEEGNLRLDEIRKKIIDNKTEKTDILLNKLNHFKNREKYNKLFAESDKNPEELKHDMLRQRLEDLLEELSHLEKTLGNSPTPEDFTKRVISTSVDKQNLGLSEHETTDVKEILLSLFTVEQEQIISAYKKKYSELGTQQRVLLKSTKKIGLQYWTGEVAINETKMSNLKLGVESLTQSAKKASKEKNNLEIVALSSSLNDILEDFGEIKDQVEKRHKMMKSSRLGKLVDFKNLFDGLLVSVQQIDESISALKLYFKLPIFISKIEENKRLIEDTFTKGGKNTYGLAMPQLLSERRKEIDQFNVIFEKEFQDEGDELGQEALQKINESDELLNTIENESIEKIQSTVVKEYEKIVDACEEVVSDFTEHHKYDLPAELKMLLSIKVNIIIENYDVGNITEKLMSLGKGRMKEDVHFNNCIQRMLKVYEALGYETKNDELYINTLLLNIDSSIELVSSDMRPGFGLKYSKSMKDALTEYYASERVEYKDLSTKILKVYSGKLYLHICKKGRNALKKVNLFLDEGRSTKKDAKLSRYEKLYKLASGEHVKKTQEERLTAYDGSQTYILMPIKAETLVHMFDHSGTKNTKICEGVIDDLLDYERTKITSEE